MTWIMGYKMHDQDVYEGHLYNDLGTAKTALIGSFVEVVKMTCSAHIVEIYKDCEAAAKELTGIFEEDFDLDHSTRTTSIAGVDFFLGNSDLMKENNIHLYDQKIKIKTDHTECTQDWCAHE